MVEVNFQHSDHAQPTDSWFPDSRKDNRLLCADVANVHRRMRYTLDVNATTNITDRSVAHNLDIAVSVQWLKNSARIKTNYGR